MVNGIKGARTVLLSVTVSIFIIDTIMVLTMASEQVKGTKRKTKTEVSQQMKQGVESWTSQRLLTINNQISLWTTER